MTDCARHRKPVIDDFFGFLRANPDQETIFHAGMSNRGRVEAAAFLKAYKFSEPQTIVDLRRWRQWRILIGNFGVQPSALGCAIRPGIGH